MISGHNFKAYLGLAGSGKSISLIEQDLIQRYLQKQKIYSNFWINLYGIQYFIDLEEILDVRNCVVAFDEIGQVLDPYAWANTSQDIRRFFQLHRHHHVDIFSTTQDISLVAKPARIHVKEWVYCEDNNWGDFTKKFMAWFGYGEVRSKQQILTTNELMKLQKGVGANPLVDDSEEDDKMTDDLDISESVILENPVEFKSWSYNFLLHKELDKFKIELVHTFCNECQQRQGEQILKEDTLKYCDYNKKKKLYILKQPLFCPNHPEELLCVKESGIYDTDYDIEVNDIEVEWRPFVPIKQGQVKVAYKGALSDKLILDKKNLPKSL